MHYYLEKKSGCPTLLAWGEVFDSDLGISLEKRKGITLFWLEKCGNL